MSVSLLSPIDLACLIDFVDAAFVEMRGLACGEQLPARFRECFIVEWAAADGTEPPVLKAAEGYVKLMAALGVPTEPGSVLWPILAGGEPSFLGSGGGAKRSESLGVDLEFLKHGARCAADVGAVNVEVGE